MKKYTIEEDKELLEKLKQHIRSYYQSEGIEDEDTIEMLNHSFEFVSRWREQGTQLKDFGARRAFELMESERDTYFDLYRNACELISKVKDGELTDEIREFYNQCQVSEYAVDNLPRSTEFINSVCKLVSDEAMKREE
jgi:hypothetical protein